MPGIYMAERAAIMQGCFALRVLDKSGKVVDTYIDHNMIVNQARIAMAMLVSEGLETHKIITKLGVGTGTQTATPTDTALTDVFMTQIIGHDFPQPGTARFFWKLGYNEANGKNISEFGLFCEDGSLFSRKVRSAIYKDSDLSFEGEWSIIF